MSHYNIMTWEKIWLRAERSDVQKFRHYNVCSLNIFIIFNLPFGLQFKAVTSSEVPFSLDRSTSHIFDPWTFHRLILSNVPTRDSRITKSLSGQHAVNKSRDFECSLTVARDLIIVWKSSESILSKAIIELLGLPRSLETFDPV